MQAGSNQPIIDGRYAILAKIGQGGMAQVFKARDNKLGRVVALKVMRPEFARDQRSIQRFMDEARAVARIDDEHAVRVFDWNGGRGSSMCYMTMEYVLGKNLRQIVTGQGAFPAQLAARIVRDVCDALGVAHAQGIIHSDVKPANVMFCPSGLSKITDFGIARLRSGLYAGSQQVAGTILYMSPEQMEGAPPQASNDLFSLGVTLYEICAGRPPYVQMNKADAATLRRWLSYRPVPSQANPLIDAQLDAIVRKALDPDPGQRYKSAAAMAESLEDYLSSHRGIDATGQKGPGNPLEWSLAFVSNTGRLGHAYPVARDMTIGSGSQADLCIGIDQLAQRHVRVSPYGCVLRVTNLGPRGTMVINDGATEEAYCCVGDVIRIGRTRLKVGCSTAKVPR